MKVTGNSSLTRIMLSHLAEKYKLKEKRSGIHLSTLIYCLTRQQFDQQKPVEPTDEEVMLFALGFGLQDILTPIDASTPQYEKDGVVYSPDFVLNLSTNLTVGTNNLCELKTTRMSAKRADEHDFPETWVEYMKGGCFIRECNTYDLTVLYMMGSYSPPFPVIKSFTFDFSEDELLDNWNYLMDRKLVYEEALASGVLVPPYSRCKDWECKYCRYSLICQTMKAGG